jgi:hypothetical protein
VVTHRRFVASQMVELAILKTLFADILRGDANLHRVFGQYLIAQLLQLVVGASRDMNRSALRRHRQRRCAPDSFRADKSR